MDELDSNHAGAVMRSLALHATILALLIGGVHFAPSRAMRAPSAPLIEAVWLDQDVVDEQTVRLAEAEQAEIVAREEAAARERAAAETAQRERELEQQRVEQVRIEREEAERQRQAEIVLEQERAAEQAAREEAERRERERQAELERERQAEEERRREAEEAERREQERLAELQRQREEEERRRREAEEARLQAELERELQAALAAEAELRSAVSSGELDRYLRQIQTRVEQAWTKPPSARAGLKCTLHVTQIPSGQVTNVTIGTCNGDAAVQQSLERAVRNASPLPTPSMPALFQRDLRLEINL